MMKYEHRQIEPAWQARWLAQQAPITEEGDPRKKYYCLVMFPYPSGRIHMGHVRNYTIGDVIARSQRLRGRRVLHPMGWDAFGLPAENAAIEQGVHPASWTMHNISYMKQQLQQLGISYDWKREITTCRPDYYHWNQWFFLKMYERDLAYRKRSAVNWCPKCLTVLANEQVIDGACWRCDSIVTHKELEQWFLRITAYAEELLAGCDRLTGWPERVLTMQRNWIGKSEGAEVEFPLQDGSGAITVFTTRPDTLYGATFMSLAPEHPLVNRLIQGYPEAAAVRAFVEQAGRLDRTTRLTGNFEKAGMFTGAYAINPLTRQPIPIWVGNFVLMEYGTGAIMAVPAHDQRDFEFARTYHLPIRLVVQNGDRSLRAEALTDAYVEEAGWLVDSGPFTGLSQAEGKAKIIDHLTTHALGKRTVNYRLRDWGISRQRYWGTPIPILYCDACGVVPVPEAQLPVVLPRDVPFTGKGGSPLAESAEFATATCPRCGGRARRETDTMDTFVDSSWYFLRYTSPRETDRPFRREAADFWMPVDQYIGGIEHAVLHLLYSRFFTKVVRDLGLIGADEPFANLLTQGMVIKDGAKMSKSRGNVVDPNLLIEKYGADTARLFSLFAAPPEKDLEWDDQAVEGASRFLQRVWRLVIQHNGRHTGNHTERDRTARSLPPFESQPASDRAQALRRATHQTIRRVTADLDKPFQFNTAIAALMEFYNAIAEWLSTRSDGHTESRTNGAQSDDAHTAGSAKSPTSDDRAWDGQESAALDEALHTLLLLLSPFAPHICEELWRQLGHNRSIFDESWPEADPRWLKESLVTIILQINGKLRGQLQVPPELDEQEVETRALADPKLQPWIEGKTIRKRIYVPGRLLNLVV
jgi:leucyl-tRNA synthetase